MIGWWDVEPDIPRVIPPYTRDGRKGQPSAQRNRVDRLKAYGNAVVPQWAYPIFAAIAAEIERAGGSYEPG